MNVTYGTGKSWANKNKQKINKNKQKTQINSKLARDCTQTKGM